MNTQFTPDENVVFSALTKRDGTPTDLPNGVPSLSVRSFFLVRDGQPINLNHNAITFSKLSTSPDDAGQYLATVNRTILTTEAANTVVTQQSGDVFGFAFNAQIEPGLISYSENKFAEVVNQSLDDVLDRLSDLQDSVDALDSSVTIDPLAQVSPDKLSTNQKQKPLCLIRGDSYGQAQPSHDALRFDADGVPDGTGATLTARDCDDAVVFQLSGLVAAGEAVISFNGSQTQAAATDHRLKYDVQLTDGVGRKTIAQGLLQLMEDQSR